jgi:hypothetical protein
MRRPHQIGRRAKTFDGFSAPCGVKNHALVLDVLDRKKLQVRQVMRLPNGNCRRSDRGRAGNRSVHRPAWQRDGLVPSLRRPGGSGKAPLHHATNQRVYGDFTSWPRSSPRG